MKRKHWRMNLPQSVPLKRKEIVSVEFQDQKIFPSENCPFKVDPVLFKKRDKKIGTESRTHRCNHMTDPSQETKRLSDACCGQLDPCALDTNTPEEPVKGRAPDAKETSHLHHFILFLAQVTLNERQSIEH